MREWASLAITVLFAAALPAQVATLAVTGGRIYTGDPARPTASAMAVREGRILAIGEDVSRFVGPGTRQISLNGGTVIPGLIDAHGHMAGLGASLEMLDLRGVASEAEVARRVADAAAKSKPGEWILGRAWDQSLWPGGQFPTAESLTKAAPENPVYLTRVDGHAGWANRKALAVAGITQKTQDPPGGRILRDANGMPAGVLIDRAQSLVRDRIPEPTDEQIERRLLRAAKECVRYGLTGVHDAGIGTRELAAYRRLLATSALPLRIYAMIGGEGSLWRDYLAKGPEIGDYLTVRSVKLVADGAMGSRGAAMIEDYSDDRGNRGLLILSEADIERVASAAIRKGFQVNTHAIGDRANRTVLQAYGKVLGGANDRRFRIEHAQFVAPEDFALFKRYSIIPSMQATHATSDMRWAVLRAGPQRLEGAYAWRTFLDLGLPLANGSDFPVEQVNPLLGIYAAITRQDAAGQPPGGWMPGQRLSREEAVRSFSLDAAYAAFEERQKGSLAPGKFADFVVLDRNIFDVEPREVLTTKVVMTVVDGKVVYERSR